MKERWSKEQANLWYGKFPWLRGCNFIGSDCANRFDMWQSYKAEEHLKTAERELALCQSIGFNTVRIWLNFEAYLQEKEHFMRMLEEYISLCDKYKLLVMPVLTHEEFLPRGEVFKYTTTVGEQNYELGYHQGIAPPREEEKSLMPHHYFDYPELQGPFLEMLKEVVKTYANDSRILCWNVYNEPGFTLPQERAVELLDIFFDTVRAQNPSQPLSADVWLNPIASASVKKALELSDVISLHCYNPINEFAVVLKKIKSYGRPVLCTEWLHRIQQNSVFDIYPLLYLENVASYCWGFVVGKTQTNEPWDVLWELYEKDKNLNYDFSKWQHDLFRTNLRPYDPKEIALIKAFNDIADGKDTEEARLIKEKSALGMFDD